MADIDLETGCKCHSGSRKTAKIRSTWKWSLLTLRKRRKGYRELVESDDPDGGADEIQLSQSDDPTDYIQNYIKDSGGGQNYFILRATTADGKKTAQKVYDNQAKLRNIEFSSTGLTWGTEFTPEITSYRINVGKDQGRKSRDPTD